MVAAVGFEDRIIRNIQPEYNYIYIYKIGLVRGRTLILRRECCDMVYMYVCMHACMCKYMYMCVYMCVHVCICVCICVYMCVHVCICMHICMFGCVSVYVYICIYMYIGVYMGVYMHLCICLYACGGVFGVTWYFLTCCCQTVSKNSTGQGPPAVNPVPGPSPAS